MKKEAKKQEIKKKEKSILQEASKALVDGVLGGLTFMILIVYMSSNTLMAGHLHNSEVYVEAFGIAGVYGNIFSFLVWGFNSGFVVIAARFYGVKDYPSMHKTFKKHLLFIFGFLTCFYLYLTVIYLFVPQIYPEDPNLVFWVRAYIACAMPVSFSMFFMDGFRELFIANELYSDTLVLESFSMVVSISLSYLLAFVLGYEFYGLIIGMIVSQGSCVGLYFLSFMYGNKWKKYWRGIFIKTKGTEYEWLKGGEEDLEDQAQLKKEANQSEKEEEGEGPKLAESIKGTEHKGSEIQVSSAQGTHQEPEGTDEKREDNNKEGNREEKEKSQAQQSLKKSDSEQPEIEKIDLESGWGYFKFNFAYSITFFLDGLWWELDAIICSFLFQGTGMAAQTSLSQFLNIITLFSIGYTITLSSKISTELAVKNPNKAKRIFWIITAELTIIGLVLAAPFVLFPRQLSPLLIDSVETQIVLVKIMRIFGYSLPFLFLSGVVFAANRSINNQKSYFYGQIICNYGVHFATFLVLRFGLGLGVESLWYAFFASQASMTVYGFFIAFMVDWEKVSLEIAAQMADGKKVGGGGH